MSTTLAHRRAALTIAVTDATGQPVPGATVRVRQTRHAFWFGCNGFHLHGELEEPFASAYRQQFAALLNAATLPFYWAGYEPEPGQTAEAKLGAMARWCGEQGIVAKGHPLVWTHPAGVPRWLPNDLDAIGRLSEARVTALVERFAGLIDVWDVVNEATDPFRFDNKLADQQRRDGLMSVVRRAYRLARAANPAATLLINDYRLDADYERVIEQLVDDDGRPLYDVIGLQTHQHGGVLSTERLREVCDTFARFGVPLHFTETTLLSGRRAQPGPVDFESREPQFAPTNAADEERQAEAVAAFYTTLFEHPAVEAIVWWDFADRGAWLAAPAGLLRADGSPKPAYEALHRLIKGEWWTDTEVETDAHGQAMLNVFAGELEISVEATTARVSLPRGGCGAVTLRGKKRGQGPFSLTKTVPDPVSSRDIVTRAVRFATPPRLPRDFPEPYGSDFAWVGMNPSPDARPRCGVDEWGAVWENIGVSSLGEVKDFPLRDWADYARLAIPDISEPRRWTGLEGARERAGDRFLLAGGISIYERVHFIRGLENTWTDLYEHPDELRGLLDLLVGMNLVAIERYAAAGADGFIFCDDWGLQNRLMIRPESWREFWKPCYARIYAAAHDAGLLTFLHSCGYIVDILDDLIEAGLDVIQMDQQENMGLDLLSERFGGRITFWCPVDIQMTMAHGTLDEIRAYARRMAAVLGRPEGGFIPKWYGDPKGAGHRQEAIDAMCAEFIAIGG